MHFNDVYQGKTVFVTGHTGFKGSWLCEWLLQLGSRVAGYSLEPPTEPSHFALTGLSQRLFQDLRGDIRDYQLLQSTINRIQPDFIFHLAAQPIVRHSFKDPRATVETNLMGTFNILEAVRNMKKDCIAVLITTDKVYENKEWYHSYRETDPLGGYDPYSASKACAEILISSYFRSFFRKDLLARNSPAVAVASVRAGNVIGGGDWAPDRIVPDCVRNLEKKIPIPVRNKTATRPWQHVLEPLSGYLLLGSEIYQAIYLEKERAVDRLETLCSPFNFGPNITSNRTVLDLVQEILKYWPGDWKDLSDPHAPHEAGKLNLTIDKAFHVLNWKPQWDFERTVRETVEWYSHALSKTNDSGYIQNLTLQQIENYMGLRS